MHHDSIWRLIVVVVVLLFFAGIGVAHVINPDWFTKRSGVRKGGELLSEWNRLGFQMGGVILALFAIYTLYKILRG